MKPDARVLLILAFLAAIAGLLISNLTEEIATSATVHVMNYITNGSSTVHIADTNGIPMVNYNRVAGGPFYNPVYAGVYALAYHDKLLDKHKFDNFTSNYLIYYPDCKNDKTCWRTHFFQIADWFVAQIKLRLYKDITYGVWTYDFPWDMYDLQPPWVSGMAQGLGIQVLIRAWLLSGDSKYLSTAQLARNSFLIDTEQGGVRVRDSDTEWWYEEYADTNSMPPRVLNGMEHAVIALYELAEYTGDTTATILYQHGINSLKNWLEVFDTGWWTYYDGIGTVAKSKYHYININLTKQLFEISGDSSFQIYKKWDKYSTPFIIREFILQTPNYVDIGALILNIFFCGATIFTGFVIFNRFNKKPVSNEPSDA